VPLLPACPRLSHAEKDALIAALTARLVTADERIAAQDTRIAALEARLNELSRPPKTPDNSSKPPSQGQKQDRSASGTDRPARKSRPGVGPNAGSAPGSHDQQAAGRLPEMQSGIPRRVADPAAGL
jgi:transposase